jgi:hypothetical protein
MLEVIIILSTPNAVDSNLGVPPAGSGYPGLRCASVLRTAPSYPSRAEVHESTF